MFRNKNTDSDICQNNPEDNVITANEMLYLQIKVLLAFMHMFILSNNKRRQSSIIQQ